MKVELRSKVPGFFVEPTMLFAYPTRLADVYTPYIEQIYLPGVLYEENEVFIRVDSRFTETWESHFTWKRRAYHHMRHLISGEKVLDFPSRFVFDTRFDTDKNIAHVLENSVSRLLFAKRSLSQHLNESIKIHAILGARASSLALEIYNALDIPVICTDDRVFGNVVEISPYCDLLGVHADQFNIEIKGYNSNTPEKVFISRRNNRRLVNNQEVTEFLEKQGFTTYYFEDLSVAEKWSIARNAKTAVAVHGAGSSNFIFNHRGLNTLEQTGSGLQLIELFSPNFTIQTYRYFSKILNGKWCGVRGQITPETISFLDFDKKPRNTLASPIKDPFRISLDTLKVSLEYIGSDSDCGKSR